MVETRESAGVARHFIAYQVRLRRTAARDAANRALRRIVQPGLHCAYFASDGHVEKIWMYLLWPDRVACAAGLRSAARTHGWVVPRPGSGAALALPAPPGSAGGGAGDAGEPPGGFYPAPATPMPTVWEPPDEDDEPGLGSSFRIVNANELAKIQMKELTDAGTPSSSSPGTSG